MEINDQKLQYKRKKDAERQRRYREAKLRENEDEYRKKAVLRQQKYVEALKQCETEDSSNKRKRKYADHQQVYRSKKKKKNEKDVFIARQELEVFQENAVETHNIGRMTYCCAKCGGLMFKQECSKGSLEGENPIASFSLCCSYGAVKIPPIKEPPILLQNLLTGTTKRDRDFRENIRAYNSSLAFASMCVTGGEYKFKTRGPYCFRINGQVYHSISQMEPESGKRPSFSQIYIYDQHNELENRLHPFRNLDRTVMAELQDMMKEVNPYARKYSHVGDIMKQEMVENVQLVLKCTGKNVDPRRYNLPTGTDIAVILPTENTYTPSNRDVIVYKNANHHPKGLPLMRIDGKHPMYDPLMYVLMFPFGDKGWELGSFTVTNRKNNKCTALQYYKHRLIPRGGNSFNTIHRMGRLFQQYIVDMYVKIECDRLQYVRLNQNKLQAELYQGLADVIHDSDGPVDGSQIGKKVILPSSFTGGARYQHQLYQDAMAIVRRYGKPDFFITFTCNSNWKEITNALLPEQIPANRPDIVARVFKQKLQSFLKDLTDKSVAILGRTIGLIYVIEWQKQGPPHAHILAICDQESKPWTPEDFDQIVCAEIPDKSSHPELHQIVTKFMMHGPCGSGNPNSPCMEDGKCTKKYPKEFVEKTFTGDGYPHYRRRNDQKCVTKSGITLDNRWVVPYNPYLSKKYNAHINVEICSSIKSCKYLYKYVYKGPDMASVALHAESSTESGDNNRDEINKYINSRFVTASEGCWRIFEFDIHGRDPSIQRLAVHEENSQMVTFDERKPEEAISNSKNTTLLAWFKLNEKDDTARKFKYHEIPEHYVWDCMRCMWKRRQRGNSIGRMYSTNPAQGERHYLRLLLHHIAGATSFADLKKTPDGVVHQTFKETALALGLLESDGEWDECLSEAATSFMPWQLRSLFITILIFGEPAKPSDLWQKYKDVMGEDLLHQATASHQWSDNDLKKQVENEVLLILQDELEAMDRSLEAYNLPSPDKARRIGQSPRVIQDELFNVDAQKEIAELKGSTLNTDQQAALNMIMKAVNDGSNPHRMFFINAPGGYGKTFLLEVLLSCVRSTGKIALAVASSGIAAELLEGGRTAHSRFKIPIPVNETSVCRISKQSAEAKLIKNTSLIIWDEIMMSHVDQIDCVDRTLQDIMGISQPFGGITTVFGGDPRQILPVVRHGDQARIVKSCIHSSSLWSKIKQIKLRKNMRLNADEVDFSHYLLTIGDGTAEKFPYIGEDIIKVPEEYLVDTLDTLISKVFPDIQEGYLDKYFVSRRAILTPKNDNVDKINEMIMERFPGISKTYLSADTIAEDDLYNTYPTDFLNSITLSGMPPHSIMLKVGAPVILLRNLRVGPGNGLRNGTRLIILKLGDKVLEAEIASGVNRGKHVLLPRITIVPSDTELPFTLKRRQFPIRPCFAMSTNKAQGQTLDFVGVYLPENVFTHGQLYVAFSRVRNSSGLAVFVNNTDGFTKNIVYREVL